MKGADRFMQKTLSFWAQCVATALMAAGDTVMKKPVSHQRAVLLHDAHTTCARGSGGVHLVADLHVHTCMRRHGHMYWQASAQSTSEAGERDMCGDHGRCAAMHDALYGT
eukprot:363221-Chlamydomonas_euryale.AAC.8